MDSALRDGLASSTSLPSISPAPTHDDTSNALVALNVASVTCCGLFLLYLPLRIRHLSWHRKKLEWGWLFLSKMFVAAALCILLLVQLAGAFGPQGLETSLVASLIASTASMFGLAILLVFEQRYSALTSDCATLYLLASVVLDFMSLTLPSESSSSAYQVRPLPFRFVASLALLVLEALPRTQISDHPHKLASPEDASGILGRVVFAWINPILLHGYRSILVHDDLPPLSKDLNSGFWRKCMLRAWDMRAKPENSRSLLRALFQCVRRQMLAAVVPRLFLIIFRYSQPVLIRQSIKYVTAPPQSVRHTYGYWLGVTAMAIYTGLAISNAVYQHRLNRVKLAIRSALAGLIHHKAMNLYTDTYNNPQVGKAVTLMSTDVDSLSSIGEMAHETWAQMLEVVIGLILLAQEVGWLWPLPIVLIFLCSRVSRYVAQHLQPRQTAWNQATETRITALSAALGAMKMLKMLNFQDYVSRRVTELRQKELLAASKVRWMMVYYNASANALGIFSPAITLAIFAIMSYFRGQSLDAETAFTTVAILTMVTHPANMVMTFIPRIVGALSGFERIQKYLLEPELRDSRHVPAKPIASSTRTIPLGLGASQVTDTTPAVRISHLTVGRVSPILLDLTWEVAHGSVVFVSGAVGSGKSTLLRSILGEVIQSPGSVSVTTKRISYCAQKPWLPNGTIRQIIQGMAAEDDVEWYRRVTEACCLLEDFESLPRGDCTPIGSDGSTLSGGQKQRVALARALYSRYEIFLLDDICSGLDGSTERTVMENLVGDGGLFKHLGATVVIVSNSAQYYHLADEVIVLGDHGIQQRGRGLEMKHRSAAILKTLVGNGGEAGTTSQGPSSENFDRLNAQVRREAEAEVDLARKTGDLAIYRYYFGFVGWVNFLLVSLCTASYSFFITIPQYWLELWTAQKEADVVWYYVGGYLLLSVLSWTSTSGSMWSTQIRLAPSSGSRAHQRLLDTVFRAPLSYFSANEKGSILTRFSQDIQLIDKDLPSAYANLSTQIYKLLAQIVLLYTAQQWLWISLPVCFIVVYCIQKVYLRTSRQLRFLDLESRGAVFSSFLESVEGLETLRSFGWKREAVLQNVSRLNDSLSPDFYLLSLQRWLNIVLDLMAAVIATLVVSTAVVLRDQTTGGQVGVALNILIVANTTLLRLVEYWTTLEISLGAVSRLKILENTLPSEDRGEERWKPPSGWPSKGRVEFKDVTASYLSDSVALRNISLSIDGGELAVICGRTGSGKSSLLLALLRMIDIRASTIEVDGVDIGRISRDWLRGHCFVSVSQDALLLPDETLRFNLDPAEKLPARILIKSLTQTGLWTHLTGSTDDRESSSPDSILDKMVSALRPLSFGQCQLFALSRAIARTTELRQLGLRPIILLDEITAAFDVATESGIRELIHEEFISKGHTVIMVSHRVGVTSGHSEDDKCMVVEMRDGQLDSVTGGHGDSLI